MRKGKGFFKKLLAVTAIAGGAAVLITKLKKDCCRECDGDDSDEAESFDEENDTSARNYVPISHGEEDAASKEETDSEKSGSEEMTAEEITSEEETAAKETHSQETVSEASSDGETAPSAEEIAAKLEQAVAETEARYEEAVREAKASNNK